MIIIETLLAQKKELFGGMIQGEGPLGKTWTFATKEGVIAIFNKVISNIIAILTISAGLWFILMFIIGGFSWLTAGGDKNAMENAQKKITHAVIGFVIVVAAIFLVDLLGKLLGLEILNPGKFILNMWGKQ